MIGSIPRRAILSRNLSLSNSLSITARLGWPRSLSSVGSIILVAEGEADQVGWARGTLVLLPTTTSFVPLPRLVLPTQSPLFLPARTSRRQRPLPTWRGLACRAGR